jgi:hypothetical protein
MLPGEAYRRAPLVAWDDFIAMRFEDIVQELHVKLIVLDDQNPFRVGPR